ncbi:aminotransferase class IV [Marinigracilibium pacificum]|uniref:aminotransferase class IV n=1 Tax=Marinigracilibium pacificum TaxID=2729599 RepID=UPI00146F6306
MNNESPLLKYHQSRINRTFDFYFPDCKPIDLEKVLSKQELPQKKDKYKIRLVYDQKLREISINKYIPKKISSLRLIETSDLDYSFKFEDRKRLMHLYDQRNEADDIVIIKEGKVTDSSYSNLVFKKGEEYFTPLNPLLKGTRREKLLEDRTISTIDFNVRDLDKFESVTLINAMLELGEIEIPIENIIK